MCGSKLYHVFVYTVYLVIEDSANLTVFKKQPPTWLTANRNLTKLIFLLTFNKDSMATTLNWRKFTNRLQTDSNKDSTTHISSKMHRHWPCLFPLLTKTVIFRKTLFDFKLPRLSANSTLFCVLFWRSSTTEYTLSLSISHIVN